MKTKVLVAWSLVLQIVLSSSLPSARADCGVEFFVPGGILAAAGGGGGLVTLLIAAGTDVNAEVHADNAARGATWETIERERALWREGNARAGELAIIGGSLIGVALVGAVLLGIGAAEDEPCKAARRTIRSYEDILRDAPEEDREILTMHAEAIRTQLLQILELPSGRERRHARTAFLTWLRENVLDNLTEETIRELESMGEEPTASSTPETAAAHGVDLTAGSNPIFVTPDSIGIRF